jgi:hypothetical protein
MAIRLNVDGTWKDLGFYPDYNILHKAVEGYIEAVRFPTPIIFLESEDFVTALKNTTNKLYTMMYVNEEGLLLNLPINTRASEMANQVIVGNVVLFTKEEEERDMRDDECEGKR